MNTTPDLRTEVDGLRRRVEAAESVLAIQALKARYGELVDSRFVRGQPVDGAHLAVIGAEVADLFTEDGVWTAVRLSGVSTGAPRSPPGWRRQPSPSPGTG